MKKKELIKHISELLIENTAASVDIEMLVSSLAEVEAELEYKEKKLELAYKKIGELVTEDE